MLEFLQLDEETNQPQRKLDYSNDVYMVLQEDDQLTTSTHYCILQRKPGEL